jgi:PPOX class probable F420-dependent enzyme
MPTRLGRRLAAIATRPHLPRRTVRLRLTLLYGTLFLVSGALLLGITYALVNRATSGPATITLPDGSTVSLSELPGAQAGNGTAEVSTSGGSASGQVPSVKDVRSLVSRQHDDQMRELLIQSGIALGVMSVLSVVLGWVVAGRVLRPLRTITTTTRDISATSLHQRLGLDGPDDELKDLGDTIDHLLSRLERAFEAQRQFVANASHELRTPLARQRTVAQVALDDPTATVGSLRTAHERVLAAGADQERLIEALLTLARGQAGLNRRDPIDLADVTATVIRGRRAAASRAGLELRAELGPAFAVGDARLAEQLVANLVDNAIRHNHPGGRISIVTGTRTGGAVLSVSNTGPIVPPTPSSCSSNPSIGSAPTGPFEATVSASGSPSSGPSPTPMTPPSSCTHNPKAACRSRSPSQPPRPQRSQSVHPPRTPPPKLHRPPVPPDRLRHWRRASRSSRRSPSASGREEQCPMSRQSPASTSSTTPSTSFSRPSAGMAPPVGTPVWFAAEGGVLYAWTDERTGKVKRIRNEARVAVRRSNRRGIPTGPAYAATARVLAADQGRQAYALMKARYRSAPLVYGAVGLLLRVTRRGHGFVAIAIEPAATVELPAMP